MKKAEIKHDEAAKLIEHFNDNGIESMSEMNDFLSNAPNMTAEKTEKIESISVEALKELNPEMTDEAAGERIKEMKVAAQSDL